MSIIDELIRTKAKARVEKEINKIIKLVSDIWKDSDGLISAPELLIILNIIAKQNALNRHAVLLDTDIPKEAIGRAERKIAEQLLKQLETKEENEI